MTELIEADLLAREHAIDPRHSFIVQAPAGSGKTELLIQRVLALLAVVREPEEILAITFTRKAASEMRSRVVEALVRGDNSSPPDAAHEKKTWELARAALARNDQQHWKLLEMPGRLRIQTIDSLSYSLIRQMPVTSAMGGVVNVTDNPDEFYREAARLALAELNSDDEHAEAVEHLLEHLGGDVSSAQRLLVTMLKKRSHWLPHVFDPKSRRVFEHALHHAVEDRLQQLDSLISVDVRSEIAALCVFSALNLGMEVPGDNFPEPHCENLSHWKDVADLLLTTEGTWRSRVTRAHGFPPTDEGRRAKTRLADVIASLRDISDLEAGLHAIRSLPDPAYSDAQWGILQALFKVLVRATVHLNSVFALRGVLDHQAVQERSIEALGPGHQPTDLAERLDYAIQHILVDEFQDTSIAQFHLLEHLVEGWEPDDGRTLFLVGDPMQSIYRFREAEVGLFLHARKMGIGPVQLKPLRLSQNFRSRDEIVDWVNRSFPHVMPAHSNAEAGAVSYAPSIATREDKGCVRIHPFYSNNAQAEGEKVVQIVHQRLQDLPDDGTIAILARSRTHFPAIAAALREADIPYRGNNLECLGDRQEVRDLLTLTRALLHPGDRTAWLGVLRAPWCALSLADLTTLLGSSPYRAVPDLLADDEIVNQLSIDGQSRVERLYTVLKTSWKDRRRRSLPRWIEGSWIALGGPATLATPLAGESAKAFFKQLGDLDEGGDIVDFAELEEHISSIYAPPDPSDGIRVELMTIHTAKGLQFDTVIMPGLGKKTRHDDKQLLVWIEHPTGDDIELLMAPIKSSFHSSNDPKYDFIRELKKEQDGYEQGRLLYVAATRAEEQLHVLGHVNYNSEKDEGPKPTKNTLLEKLWPAVRADFENAVPKTVDPSSPVQSKKVTVFPQAYRRLSLDWTLPTPPEGAPLPSRTAIDTDQREVERVVYSNNSSRHVGTIVHRALMRIARDGLSDWTEQKVLARKDLWERLLIDRGISRERVEEYSTLVVEALGNVISDPRGQWILSDHPLAQSEHDVTTHADGITRRYFVDRTFVEDGVRWIIDFKTGRSLDESIDSFLERELERYRLQLEGYARLFAGEGRPIKLGLYFPLEPAWTEWEIESTPA